MGFLLGEGNTDRNRVFFTFLTWKAKKKKGVQTLLQTRGFQECQFFYTSTPLLVGSCAVYIMPMQTRNHPSMRAQSLIIPPKLSLCMPKHFFFPPSPPKTFGRKLMKELSESPDVRSLIKRTPSEQRLLWART